MATTITVTGNLVEDEVRLNHTSDGTAIVNFTVADNTRYYDADANQWKQAGEATYWSVEVFGGLAERAAEHASKGQRLIIIGRTKTRVWTDQDGTGHRELRINADDVALSWKFGPRQESTGNVS
jgi:single-strand DNA-binding protein